MKVLCDIDGVIVDPCKYVQEYLHKDNRWDWEEYFKHTSEMPPIPHMIVIVNDLLWNVQNEVIFVTGRPESNRSLTRDWLLSHLEFLAFEPNLIMRQPNDTKRATVELKLDACYQHLPDLVIEDEPKAVERISKEGFKVLQVYGYRATGDKDYTPGCKKWSNS